MCFGVCIPIGRNLEISKEKEKKGIFKSEFLKSMYIASLILYQVRSLTFELLFSFK